MAVVIDSVIAIAIVSLAVGIREGLYIQTDVDMVYSVRSLIIQTSRRIDNQTKYVETNSLSKLYFRGAKSFFNTNM